MNCKELNGAEMNACGVTIIITTGGVFSTVSVGIKPISYISAESRSMVVPAQETIIVTNTYDGTLSS